MTTRNDIHRPSVINPADYSYIGYQYLGCSASMDPFQEMAIAQERQRINKIRESLGAKWSNHEHGGNCHVCGAHALHCVVWHHKPTNTFIRTGEDCADKMEMGDMDAFKRFRSQVENFIKARAGKRKAMMVLWELGIPEAACYAFGWLPSLAEIQLRKQRDEIYDQYMIESQKPHTDPTFLGATAIRAMWDQSEKLTREMEKQPNEPRECRILRDLINNLIKYGSWSEKQIAFAKKLCNDIPNLGRIAEERAAKKAADEAAAMDAPTGKTVVTGKIVSVKFQNTPYGDQIKMLVVDDRGFKVWTTMPTNIHEQFHTEYNAAVEAGNYNFPELAPWAKNKTITFTATLTPSNDDKKFAFGKRPTKAALV